MSSPVAPPPATDGAPETDAQAVRVDAAVETAAAPAASQPGSAFSGAAEAEVCAGVLGDRRHGL